MKNIRNSIIILLIILSMNISGQITNYINNLNGTVKQIINRESSYSVPITTIKEYDLEGCLKSESVYNGNGFNKDSLKSINKFTYKIDNKNRIFEILIVNQDKEKRKNIIKYKSSYYTVNKLRKGIFKWKSYDVICRFTNNHKEYKTKVVFEFGMFREYYKWNKDKTQLLQMRFETDEEDWEEFICNYSYNDKNQLELEEYKSDIDTVFDIEFIQDSLGNVITHYVFKSTESSSFKTTYKYDKNNNCIQEKKIYHNGCFVLTTYQYEYDEDNKLLNNICISKMDPKMHVRNLMRPYKGSPQEFPIHKNELAEVLIDYQESSGFHKISYEYNELGNCITERLYYGEKAFLGSSSVKVDFIYEYYD